MKKAKSLEHIPESVVSVLSAAARASNTSLEKLGYDTEDDNMDEDEVSSKKAGTIETSTETLKKVHFEDDKMAENEEMADSGNGLTPEKNMPNHPDTQKAKYNAKSTTKQLTTADELLEDQQDFLDLFKNGRYGLNADDLYDEEADELDEKFAEKNSLVKAKGSDGILSCGRCFNVVCVDCQKHTKYDNQYRAMFVLEGKTSILPDKVIKYRKKELAAGGKRRPLNKQKVLGKKEEVKKEVKKGAITASTTDDLNNEEEVDEEGDFSDPRLYDHYFQVICEECKAEIGVYDRDQVYHFYDVCA